MTETGLRYNKAQTGSLKVVKTADDDKIEGRTDPSITRLIRKRETLTSVLKSLYNLDTMKKTLLKYILFFTAAGTRCAGGIHNGAGVALIGDHQQQFVTGILQPDSTCSTVCSPFWCQLFRMEFI